MVHLDHSRAGNCAINYTVTAITIMRLIKTIRLAWTFYRNFLLLSATITAVCIRIFWINRFTGFFGIFWCKILSLALTYYFINANKKKEYYYYLNLGVSKTLLWASTLLFDLALFLGLLILVYQLK